MEPAGKEEAKEAQNNLAKNHDKIDGTDWLLLGGCEHNSSYRDPILLVRELKDCTIILLYFVP